MVVLATPDVAATRSMVTEPGPPSRRSARTAARRRWSTDAARGRPGRGAVPSVSGMLTSRGWVRGGLAVDLRRRVGLGDRQRREQPEDEDVRQHGGEGEREQDEHWVHPRSRSLVEPAVAGLRKDGGRRRRRRLLRVRPPLVEEVDPC